MENDPPAKNLRKNSGCTQVEHTAIIQDGRSEKGKRRRSGRRMSNSGAKMIHPLK